MKLNKICRQFGFLCVGAESTLSPVPLIEVVGKGRVLIENHNGIREYGSSNICVKVKDGYISIIGKELFLSQISKERVVITGHLESVVLQGDE